MMPSVNPKCLSHISYNKKAILKYNVYISLQPLLFNDYDFINGNFKYFC